MSALISKIKEKYPTMSKGHKKIADFIFEEYDKAAFLTAGAFGKQVSVSESTVVRFASELGYDGYPEMQKVLQEMIKSKLTSVQRIEVSNSKITEQNVIEKVLTADIELIRKTLTSVDKAVFSQAVKAINNARKIYILGVRSSASLASFLAFNFNPIYDNVVFVDTSSPSEIFESLFRISCDDICIAITFPRYSNQIINALQFVSERGAKIVAITDSDKTSIAKFTNYLLIAKSDMASFVDSLVAPLSLINALIVAVAASKKETVYSNFDKLEMIWDKYDVYEKDEAND